jgi:serine/threonine-protein kinase RsbT
VEDEERLPIRSDADIVLARQKGRELALGVGFSRTDLVLITTAISELARNILLYAKQGEILLKRLQNGSAGGILIVARDEGPGIRDVERAMQPGYSTSGGLGLGLPGVRRLMDEVGVDSKVGEGTTVVAKKWKV